MKLFLELFKARILVMSLVTMSVGYILGREGQPFEKPLYLASLIGIACVAAGAAAINHILEARTDALMIRTQNRPIPSGKLTPTSAWSISILIICLGLFILYTYSTPLILYLAFGLIILYDFIYTPLKRLTTLNTYIGGIPGAIPPLCGWAAAQNALPLDAWILFSIFYFWQLPHFYAIAYMYKNDYQNANFKMMVCSDETGLKTARYMVITVSLLFGVSILPLYTGLMGWLYAVGLAGATYLYVKSIVQFANTKTEAQAKKVLKASIIYQPLLILFIILDHLLL